MVIETGEDISLRNGAVVQNNGSRPATTVLNAGHNLVIESKTNVNNAKGPATLSADGRTVIKEASIQTGTTVYSSSKGNAELGNNTRITGADVTVLSNGTISSSAVIDAKDTAHIEAGKPSFFGSFNSYLRYPLKRRQYQGRQAACFTGRR
ncbi:fhaB domain protein [Neisseria meningitidis NM422]|nr:fhaB domain protein [Neisseria meningitidis NM422]